MSNTDLDPFAAWPPKAFSGFRAGQLDLDDAHVAAACGGVVSSAAAASSACGGCPPHEVVAVAASRGHSSGRCPDLAPAPAPALPGVIVRVSSGAAVSSSSTIFRGRSGQSLQHFMSTEYIRAMQ